MLQWIQHFLKDRTQRVRVANDFSGDVSVLSGIPQGSILGPILFTIFINDLPDQVSSICRIFADDTKLYNEISRCIELQKDIDNLMNWSDTWQLHFNSSKCKVLHVGKKNPGQDYFMMTGNDKVTIDHTTEEKDLGITFDTNLKFDRHINNVISKVNKMLGIIRRSFTYLDNEVITCLYKSHVRPHLEYANSIWFPYRKGQSAALEKVQRRATRMIKSIKHLPYSERLHILNLPSLKYRRTRGDLIQTYKIFNGIDNLDTNTFFQLATNLRTRNSQDNIFIRHCRTNKRKYSFSNRVAPVWNKLPVITKQANNLNTFKNFLDDVKFLREAKFEYDD